MNLRIVPMRLDHANLFVSQLHRHHPPARGHKFSIGVEDETGELHGVAIVGRPVARHRDDGRTLEVLRSCTDGTANVNSMLYGATARAAFALGYDRIGTYTLATESGASLRGAGWRLVAQRRARAWSDARGPRANTSPTDIPKLLWEASA